MNTSSITSPFDMNLYAEVEEIPLPYFERKYYQIDNFYKNPEAVLEYFHTECKYDLFKKSLPNTRNGKEFSDRRHTGSHYMMHGVAEALKVVCGAKTFKNDPGPILTNTFQMHDRDYNNYKDNYWWPHLDHGWTALIYFNEGGCEGTNLYHRPNAPKLIAQHGMDNLFRKGEEANSEHTDPWADRDSWILGGNVKSAFNRVIIFPSKIYHGQAVESDRWFDEVRMNQVIFFNY